jgi:hypothetical protein
MSGGQNFLTDESTLAVLSSNFTQIDANKRRDAERLINTYSSSMTDSQMRGMLTAAGRMRGYSGPNIYQDMLETRFREQGMSPTDAFNMAKTLSADTRTKEFYFDYYQRKERQLSNLIEKENADFYESGLGRMGYATHSLFGRYTALAETGAAMAVGRYIGGFAGPWGAFAGTIAGAAMGTGSNWNFYKSVGQNMGLSGNAGIRHSCWVFGCRRRLGRGCCSSGRLCCWVFWRTSF